MTPIVALSVVSFLILIVAYNMIDGRNVTIRHLRQDLDSRNTSLDKAKLAYDAVTIERDKALKRLDQERKARDERITKIVSSLAHLEWDREKGDRYRLTIGFDPRMIFYGSGDAVDREFIARDLAEQVFHEIVTSKFVESAEQRRREWEAKNRRPYTF